jgi:hypothetical protein
MDLVLKHMRARDPFEAKHPFYAVIETAGSNKEHDREVCVTFYLTMLILILILTLFYIDFSLI